MDSKESNIDTLVVYPTDYAVICEGDEEAGIVGCGRVSLNRKEYVQQLNRPYQGWRCPNCGGGASWDDNCPATNVPE